MRIIRHPAILPIAVFALVNLVLVLWGLRWPSFDIIRTTYSFNTLSIPFFGPLLTLTKRIPRSWALGYREIGKTRLNVSAGIGSEHMVGLCSIRVNCPPEMTLIVIEPA